MTPRRFIGLLIAAFVAISGALYLSTQRNLPRDPHGTPLLPSLAKELGSVTSMSITKGSATPVVTIHKQGEQWTVAQRADYPADVPKLRKLLQDLSDAKIREEKTSNPASYSIIGVEDPLQAGATGAQIEVVARDGKHAVVVGKPVGTGNFVRRPDEKTSFVVEPGISFESEPRFWIETRLLDIPTAKLRSIEVKPGLSPSYTLRRVPKGGENAAEGKGAPQVSGDFVLDAVPPTRKAADAQTLAPSPTAFSGLTAEDVTAAADIDFSKPSIVTLSMDDGSTVTLTGTAIGDKRWIQVAAPADASLSARTRNRAFEIASYRYDGIFRPLEQLLVPKTPPLKPAPAPASKLPKKPAPAPT
jgi:Domain of unknown function (DUF4340)